MKDRRVGVVHDDGTFSVPHRSAENPFLPDVIGDDDVVGEGHGHPLDDQEQLVRQASFSGLELVGVELGNDVMDVQDDLCPGDLRNDGTEHLEIRDIVYMYHVVRLTQVHPGNPVRGEEQEFEQPEKIRKLPFLVEQPLLDPVDVHPVDLSVKLVIVAGKRNDVYAIAPRG